jgi:hypothetical protein
MNRNCNHYVRKMEIIEKAAQHALAGIGSTGNENHAASLASLAASLLKCCIIELRLAASSSARLKRLPLGS